MSDPAAPWWADVQHLRPRDDAKGPSTPRRARGEHASGGADAAHGEHASRAAQTPSSTRFRRQAAEAAPVSESSLATLEHEVAPRPSDASRTPDPADTAWLEELWARERADAGPAWDAAIEEAFASSPSWAKDEDWLLPKGADRIENGRRTIEIRGQVDRVVGFTAPAETHAATRTGRRRPTRSPAERLAGRPDRIAMWAFLLGVLLIVIATLSAPGGPAA